jgi:sigma-E factor negative regulatory protein RseC
MIALKLTDSEGVSALAAIASLVPYYVALWLMRDRIQQRISFNLED